MQLLTIGQAAKLLGMKVSRLSYLARAGRVPVAETTATGRKLFNPAHVHVLHQVKDRQEIHTVFWSVKEAAKHLEVSVSTVYKKIKKNLFLICPTTKKEYGCTFLIKQEVEDHKIELAEAKLQKSQKSVAAKIEENKNIVSIEVPDLTNLDRKDKVHLHAVRNLIEGFGFQIDECIEDNMVYAEGKRPELLKWIKGIVIDELIKFEKHCW